MQHILGNSGTLKISIADVLTPVFCCTDVNLRWNKEVVGATTITSGNNKEKRTRLFEWFVSISGITKVNDSDGEIDWFEMTNRGMGGNIQFIQIEYRDADNNTRYVSGNVIMPSGELNTNASDFAIATIEFAGTGEMTISDSGVTPSGLVYDTLSDWWNTVNGNAFIDGASSVNGYTLQSTDVILEVDVEGNEYDIVTGSPGNRQAQPDLANHKIKFLNTFDGAQTVFVLFNRPV